MTPSDFRSKRPEAVEYNEFYDGYVQTVPPGDVDAFLNSQREVLLTLLRELKEEQIDFKYQEGKWTLREVFGHLIDTERIFSYRMMCIARGDKTPLPGMDQNVYTAAANFSSRTWRSVLDEFGGLRTSNLALASSFTEENLNMTGNASGFDISVRALIWILAGHCEHHINVLNDRYLLRK